jgi:hypothetical protein
MHSMAAWIRICIPNADQECKSKLSRIRWSRGSMSGSMPKVAPSIRLMCRFLKNPYRQLTVHDGMRPLGLMISSKCLQRIDFYFWLPAALWLSYQKNCMRLAATAVMSLNNILTDHPALCSVPGRITVLFNAICSTLWFAAALYSCDVKSNIECGLWQPLWCFNCLAVTSHHIESQPMANLSV